MSQVSEIPQPVTEYMRMLTEAHEIKTRFNILTAVSAWIILAGFITLPNTFTSLQNIDQLKGNREWEMLQNTIRNIGLLPFAITLCVVGLITLGVLWKMYQNNWI
jgi:hypothetical protein